MFAPLGSPRVLGMDRRGPIAVLADFNTDGRADLLVSDTTTVNGADRHQFSVYLNRSGGEFAPAFKSSPVGSRGLDYAALAVGDFNEDGTADVVTSRAFPEGGGAYENMTILIGTPEGRLVRETPWANCINPPATTMALKGRAVAAADVNGDGHLDIISTTTSAQISVVLGDGHGGFGAPILSGIGMTYGALLVGDLNFDGAVDVVTISDSGMSTVAETTIDVNVGRGDGTFGYASTRHVDMRFADVDGVRAGAFLVPMTESGAPDLVLFGESGADEDNGGLYVLSATGGYRFDVVFHETRSEDSSRTQSIVVMDVDGDRDLDIVKIPAPGMGNGEVMINEGLWRFAVRLPFPATDQRIAAAVSTDLAGSSFADLALLAYPVGRSGEAVLSVWRNDSATPCEADVDRDGAVTPADLAAFTQRWVEEIQSNERRFEDLNGDGVVDGADVAAYVRLWFEALSEGC
ncbi:MAG: VCBS repeat-containing protein [Phycisphaeraceae bacterium]|nr:VCBS repeat-containing protein [Phycisphaeraceae bacterium]